MVADSAGDNFHFIWSHDNIFYRVSSEPVCIYVVLIKR